MLPGYCVEGILDIEGQNDLMGTKARSRVMDCTKQLYELSGPIRMPTAKLEDAGVVINQENTILGQHVDEQGVPSPEAYAKRSQCR